MILASSRVWHKLRWLSCWKVRDERYTLVLWFIAYQILSSFSIYKKKNRWIYFTKNTRVLSFSSSLVKDSTPSPHLMIFSPFSFFLLVFFFPLPCFILKDSYWMGSVFFSVFVFFISFVGFFSYWYCCSSVLDHVGNFRLYSYIIIHSSCLLDLYTDTDTHTHLWGLNPKEDDGL